MATKRVSPHTSSCTIRLTKIEKEKVIEYCEENGLTVSEYFRYLARTHLKLGPSLDSTPKKKSIPEMQ